MPLKPKQHYIAPGSLQFRASDIRDMGGLACSVKPDMEPLADVLEKPGRILRLMTHLEFSIGTSGILLEGTVDGAWELECSRCLRVYSAKFSEPFTEFFPEPTENMDVMDAVRQNLIFMTECKPLCSLNCLGLCPKCGANLNVKRCDCKPDNLSPFASLKQKLTGETATDGDSFASESREFTRKKAKNIGFRKN